MNFYGTEPKAADAGPALTKKPPFETKRLDALLDSAGIDVLIASSKHNVQYLLGGYRFFFFDYSDAIGMSRYLPLFVYPKGRPEDAFYVGASMESWEEELSRFWLPFEPSRWSSVDAMQTAIRRLKGSGGRRLRIGVERAFLPADAEGVLRQEMPEAEIVEALVPLERLRAVKSEDELKLIRVASERVVESMLAVMQSHGPGTTKRQLAEALRREEVSRGLIFEYCLLAVGGSRNRAPSDQPWREGEILSLDSGGNFHGYIGDLARMAILGEPDAELEDLLGHVDEIQQAARRPIRPGAAGGEIYEAVEEVLRRSPHRDYVNFVAHGMGLISHEAPRLSSRAPVPYPGDDADKPLEAGMVISIETSMHHSSRGFIKLEDTVAVTPAGWEAYGDFGRGWNRGNAG